MNIKDIEKAKEKSARESNYHKSEEISGTKIKGYNFNNGVNYEKIIQSFSTTGFQASHLAKAIKIVNKMISEKAFLYLGFTSNMVTSGLRDIFRFLIENKKVDVVVTTAGGIEEDIIKCLGDFILGDFQLDGKVLRNRGINRAGNILIPNSRYVKFEEFFQEILNDLYKEQEKTKKVISGSDLISKLGEKIDNEESYLFWAYKNNIRVFCPALNDGAIGDNIYFFKFKHPNFKIDIAEDIKLMNDTAYGKKKTGCLILGAGVIKHHILNTNMMRNGADYSVYINNSAEFDGSDSGARPEEAISWGKIQPKSQLIKVFGDATILFPILVAESFAKS